MADNDLTAGYAGNFNVTRQRLDQQVTLKRYVDLTVTPFTAADTYKIIAYPAHSLLLEAGIITDVAAGGTCTVDLQDDTSASTTINNDTSLNTAHTLTAGSSLPLFKAAASYIRLLANHTNAVAKFWVYVTYVPFSVKD